MKEHNKIKTFDLDTFLKPIIVETKCHRDNLINYSFVIFHMVYYIQF